MRTRVYVFAFGSSLSIQLGKRRYEFKGSSGENGILRLRDEDAIGLIEVHPMYKSGGIRFVEEIAGVSGAESYEIQTVRGLLTEALRRKDVALRMERDARGQLLALLGAEDVDKRETGHAPSVQDGDAEETVHAPSVQGTEVMQFKNMQTLKGYLCTLGAKASHLRTNDDIVKAAGDMGVMFEVG